MKRILKITLALVFGLGLSQIVHAASTDSLTVTITPNAFYAVDIDTANVVLDLGVVALGASTQTVKQSTITILSTFATTDLKLQGGITSAGTPWTFDNDTTSSETDKLAAWATFTTVARSSAPALGNDYFSGTVPGGSGSDVFDASSRYVGSSATDGTTSLFENNSGFDTKDMDALPPSPSASSIAQLWLMFRLPSATTSTTAQKIAVIVYAVAPN